MKRVAPQQLATSEHIRRPVSEKQPAATAVALPHADQIIATGVAARLNDVPQSPACRSISCRFHKISYTNILPGILTITGRPDKSATVACPSHPMPSPGVMGAAAIHQVCSPEIRLAEIRRAQVCSAQVCSQSVRVAQIRRAQARSAPISPAEPSPMQVRPAQIGPEQRRLHQARGHGTRTGSQAAPWRAPSSAPGPPDGRTPSAARRGRRGRI